MRASARRAEAGLAELPLEERGLLVPGQAAPWEKQSDHQGLGGFPLEPRTDSPPAESSTVSAPAPTAHKPLQWPHPWEESTLTLAVAPPIFERILRELREQGSTSPKLKEAILTYEEASFPPSSM